MLHYYRTRDMFQQRNHCSPRRGGSLLFVAVAMGLSVPSMMKLWQSYLISDALSAASTTSKYHNFSKFSDVFTATSSTDSDESLIGTTAINMTDLDESLNGTAAINGTDLDESFPTGGSRQSTPLMQENPTNLRVLVAVPMYNLKQYPHFERWLDSLVDLCFCEQEIQTLHIVIYITTVVPVPILQEIKDRTTSCHERLDFDLSIKLRSPSIGHYLVDEHRAMFYEQINNYDLFIYNEEDIHIRPKHILAYWRQTAILRNSLPDDQFADYSIGFMRYEEPPATKEFEPTPRMIFEFDWDRSSPEAFAKKHIIPRLLPFTGSYYFNSGDTFHQGMYMATATQLEKWKERGPSCHFNDTKSLGGGLHREKVSSLQLFQGYGCNVTQLLPTNGYQDFLLHHMSNKYASSPRWSFKIMTSSQLGGMLADAIEALERNRRKEEEEEVQSNSTATSSGETMLRQRVNDGSISTPRWIHIHKPKDIQDVDLNETIYSEYIDVDGQKEQDDNDHDKNDDSDDDDYDEAE